MDPEHPDRRGEPICRTWIDVHYVEEEITLLEEELLPVLERVLLRMEAFDQELERQQEVAVAVAEAKAP